MSVAEDQDFGGPRFSANELFDDAKRKDTIWKYYVDQPVRHEIPAGAQFLLFAKDPTGHFAAWFRVNEKRKKIPHLFEIVGTGHDIPSGFEILGSCVNGDFVWHLAVLQVGHE